MNTRLGTRALATLVALGAVLFVTSCEPDPTDPGSSLDPVVAEAPGNGLRSVVFVNGNVITMNPVVRVDEAIAIRGSRIVRTGSTEALLRQAGPKSEVVDLEGRTVMPGFVDAHSHYFQSSWEFGEDWDGVQDLAIRLGTTTVGEPAVSESFLAGFRSWLDADRLKLRLSLYLNAGTDVCGNPVDEWWKSVAPSRHPQDLLWIAGLKMFADGGACNTPAVTVEFAPGTGFGDLYVTANEVAELVTEAEALGYQVIVHALGDRSLDEALDGYEQALGNGANRLRHRIDHNNLIRDDQISRYSEIGVLPVVFGHHLTGHLEQMFLGGPQGCPAAPRNEFYQNAEAPIRRLLDANPDVPVAWHNDNPPWPPYRPMADLDNLVTRRQRFGSGFCEPPPWMAANAVTVEEGLEMMTVNAAYALGREHDVGSLAPGKLADLIVLSDNPLTVPSTEIRNIAVWMTMIDGRVEYCRPGQEAVCPME